MRQEDKQAADHLATRASQHHEASRRAAWAGAALYHRFMGLWCEEIAIRLRKRGSLE